MENIIDFDAMNAKNAIINEATEKLKSEFIGIDEQIDGVMNNLRTWYLFPHLQETPLIINLWGMTGVGKTSLVRAIAKYLDMEKDLVYFNFAEIGEMSSYEIESNIEDELSNESPNRIFVYDEFQYAATLDKRGEEKDNKSGLKPFWELLDTGVLHKRFSFNEFRRVRSLLFWLYKLNGDGNIIELKNGNWVNYKECISNYTKIEIAQLHSVLEFPYDDENVQNGIIGAIEDAIPSSAGYGSSKHAPSYECITHNSHTYMLPSDFFVKYNVISDLLYLYSKASHNKFDDIELGNRLVEMNHLEFMEFVEDILENTSKGYDLCFNSSVIFVLGNLDEAYDISFSTDPDMSPDQFNRITKKISIVDIKKALKERFRNEQIARLGNIHMIYPSFSSDSFRKIISLSLNKFGNKIKDTYGYDVEFDKSIMNIIYKEAVFPTHGTRPVFSTVHEIVKTKFPLIVTKIYDDKLENVKKLVYSFSYKNTIVTVFDENDNELGKYKFKETLRLNPLRESTNDDEQALIAVHESGHFVIYTYLNDKLPEKLCSKSASSDTGGFLMREYDESIVSSAKDIRNSIKVSMAGYVAEKMIFGDNMLSNGASADLVNATSLCSKYVREWGMSDFSYVSTYSKNDGSMTRRYTLLSEDNQKYIDDAVKKLYEDCLSDVNKILKNPYWQSMLKKSAKYLSEHSAMPQSKMKELYNEAKSKDRTRKKIDSGYYKNIVDGFKD